MDRYTSTIPKVATDCDRSIEVILEEIIFRNEFGDDLVKYDVRANDVVLTFEG